MQLKFTHRIRAQNVSDKKSGAVNLPCSKFSRLKNNEQYIKTHIILQPSKSSKSGSAGIIKVN